MILMFNDIPEHKNNNLTQAYDQDMGYDIRSGQSLMLLPGRSVVIDTGLHVAIPKIMGGIIKSRSGLSFKHNIEAGNGGVIDSGYYGVCKVKLYNNDLNEPYQIDKGDKIAQMVFYIKPAAFIAELSKQLLMRNNGFEPFGFAPFEIRETDMSLWPESNRNQNGFGHSGLR